MNFLRNFRYYLDRGFTLRNAWHTARMRTSGNKL